MSSNAFLRRDASFTRTRALPASNTTVYGLPINLGSVPGKPRTIPECELIIEAPALTVGELPNAATMTYTLQDSADEAFTSPRAIGVPCRQTGAGGAGAAALIDRYRIAEDTLQFIRLAVTASNNLDVSAKKATLSMAF